MKCETINVSIQHGSVMSPNLQYHNFSSYAELSRQKTSLLQLINSYRTIFSEPGVWSESYSAEDVSHKLQLDLDGIADLRLCVDGGYKNEMLGFCWAQCLDATGIENSINTIKYYHMIGAPAVKQHLVNLIGQGEVIYVHDLGVNPSHRGKVPLHRLIYPMLHDLASRSQVNTVMFWSIPDSHISRLARRAGFEMVLEIAGMEFYLGEI